MQILTQLNYYHGYNKKIIDTYNKNVKNKIKKVAKHYKLRQKDFAPKDIHEKRHMLGLFELDAKYDKFITMGAKKYAFIKKGQSDIQITVAGVPKKGKACLKNLEDFKESLVFDSKLTNKLSVVYCDNMEDIIITDYLGNEYYSVEKSGCCLIPTDYTLGQSEEYANLINENHEKIARYKE